MAFNDRLKESRTNAGLTQEQLSEKLGIANAIIMVFCGWVAHRPNLD